MTSAPAPIGRGLHFGDEVLGLVVDGVVGAELEAGVGLFLGSDGDDHLGAEGLGQLDRHGADAGRAAMDQQRLAGLQRRRARTHCARPSSAFPGWRRLPASTAPAAPPSPGHPARCNIARSRRRPPATSPCRRACASSASVAERDDFARDFKAGQIAGAGRRRIGAGSLRDIGTVDARGCDLDQDFARSRRRHARGSRAKAPRGRRAC